MSAQGTMSRTVAGACVVFATVMVSGCQTNSLSKYNNPADACVTYRQPLIQTEQDLNQPIAAGAMIGAVMGGLIGGLATGKAGGAVAGAAMGAMAGGAMGYYESRQREAKNQAELLAAINNDAQGDATRFSGLGGSVKALQNCRRQQVAQYAQQAKAKALTPEQGTAEKARILSAIREDGDLITKVLGSVDSRVDTYVNSSEEALKTADAQGAVKSTGTKKPVSAPKPAGVNRAVQEATNLKRDATTGQDELYKSLERVAG
jgi:hypothetical protein